ncbi:hypothetical protein OQX61_21230 [Pedobacter sp. PLR]|uniref:DUF5700 domain-containing putative Zn-dependent protease n=1 Tax=Pedobacter sp. PLR TaxID=2994465 RepID=UPI002245D7A6|nr:DUF5700 domain-containing putative Zn-dependent protease [Pedobacter sp. PLR]MCX2453805.1 hypothetical protein [Pedobacter sp. PLR]
MKHSLKTFSLIFLLFFCLGKPAVAQQIDLNSLNAFWKITDRLKQGDTLSREAWKTFLQLEGNKTYIENQDFSEKFLDSYRKTLNMVYNPKNEARVQKLVDDKLNNWLVYKINQYKIHEKELKEYAAKLDQPAYLDSMYLYCWQWLPKRLHQKTTNTKIFIIGIDNDALVHRGTVVFTLWNVYNQDKLKYGIVGAHELHHVLRKPRNLVATDPSEEGILYALQVILNEGSADMIDKKYSFDKSKDIVYEYHFEELLLNKPDSIVMQLDSSMQLMAQSNGVKFKTVKDYRNLFNYTSGHNPGYYMADIIVRNGYSKELIENVQNPFYFITLYNKAAKKDKQHPPVFSDQAIDFSKALARKYWK